MREVKYRAWNKITKCFFIWDIAMGFKGTDSVWEDPEQFTGLRDKNGREIYHNDLVKDQYGFTKKVESYFSSFILIDHDVSYQLHDYAKMDVPGIASNLEVIGNIHEVPPGKE
jgi:hypothetical protein